jgi:hypothetical protein
MSKKIQYFAPVCDGKTYHIRCQRFRFRKKLLIAIDGDEFELPWGEREEIFRLGDEQAVLCVAKDGSVSIRLRDGMVPPCDAPQSDAT